MERTEAGARAALRAFDRGRSAGDRGQPVRANPYAPHSEQLQWSAWIAGYELAEGPRYVEVARR